MDKEDVAWRFFWQESSLRFDSMILDVFSDFNGSVIPGHRKHRDCFQIKSTMAMTSE